MNSAFVHSYILWSMQYCIPIPTHCFAFDLLLRTLEIVPTRKEGRPFISIV